MSIIDGLRNRAKERSTKISLVSAILALGSLFKVNEAPQIGEGIGHAMDAFSTGNDGFAIGILVASFFGAILPDKK